LTLGLRRVSVRVPAAEAEQARAALLELVPEGFEEVDGPDAVELAVYTDGDGERRVRAVFLHATSRPVEPGWEDRWRAFHRPVVAGGLWIGPPWEAASAALPAVVVDPGRAFGTGAHPTTRACIELLARGERRGRVLDAGCGSGVVAVAAARLGYGPVSAVDLDQVAVAVARETCRANGVAVDVRRADVLADDLPDADLLVANIELRVVEELLARTRSPRAITSGYLRADALAPPGFTRVDRVELDGWAADSWARS
jgi:ribosomal protein L11 methyltransferase